jgi:hypothetical protein
MSKTDKIEPEIKRALLELSVGYDYEEKEILGEKNSDNPKIKIIKKHIPPDMAAITMIERMKRQGRW